MKTLKTLLLALVPAVVLALGSVTLSGCGQSEAARIVAVDDRSVTVETATEGPKTHEVAPDAKITLDGKPAELDDLQPGDKVEVKTNQEGTLEGPQEFAVAIDAKRAEESPAGHEAERTAPADEASTPPQESGLNEPQSAEENQPRADESEPAAPAEEAIPTPQEPALNEPRAEEESQPSSDEAEPAAPADEPVPPPQESGANEPNATEEKESRSGDGAAASMRDDSQRGLSVVPGDETSVQVVHEGEISFVGKDLVRLRYHDVPPPLATEVTFLVTEETEILINGKATGIEDLQRGMTVAITAEQHGNTFVARQIAVRPGLV